MSEPSQVSSDSQSAPAVTSHPVSFDCGEVVLRGDQWVGSDPDRHVLFLHGGGQTRHSWGHSAERMAQQGWTATAVDLRGHGDSDWSPEGHYAVSENARDITSIIDQLDTRPALVGASLGGLTSLTVQGLDPEAARGLVLVDIIPRPSLAGVGRIRDFMTGHLGGFDDLDQVADAIAEYTGRPRKTDLSGLGKNVRLREDGRYYWHWDPRLISRQRDVDTRPPQDPDALLKLASTITVPVLIVRGGKSDVMTDEGVAELQAVLPHSELVVVPKAGHMVAGDDNDIFSAAIGDFLNRLD